MIGEIFIGYEPRQAEAFAVARESIRKQGGSKIIVRGLLLSELQRLGWYQRPTYVNRAGKLIDHASATDTYDGAISTEFANTRFFVPYLARTQKWVLFVDCDIMVRGDIQELISLCEQSDKALLCVQHEHVPHEASKMDNQTQTAYFRKNWSSVMAWNLEHPAHAQLTIHDLNWQPGRELHRFFWLKDHEIGALPLGWNWLAQVSPGMPSDKIKLVHWTLGGPWLPAFEDAPFANEWRMIRDQWVRADRAEWNWPKAPGDGLSFNGDPLIYDKGHEQQGTAPNSGAGAHELQGRAPWLGRRK